MAKDSKTVKVACRLPSGLVIQHPRTEERILLNGANTHAGISPIVPIFQAEMYGVTEVDAEFWAEWVAAHKDFQPLVSQAIFAMADQVSIESKIKELEKVKTGFEGLDQTSGSIKKAD